MRIFYESDDGKVFETKEECLAYENKYKNFSFIICWGDNMNFDYEDRIPDTIESTVFKSPDEMGKAIYDYSIIFIPDENALNVIKEAGREIDISTSCMEVGLNFWSDKENKWVQSNYYREKLWASLQSLNNFENNVNDLVDNIIDNKNVQE